ncbi:tetratricopeptide repeat protein [Thetidibacter halocola]|uniref:Tetratricopeptide repeat protein n=1 Tax=Thetidibacter halocola TaxID=2827239 RepID=A0A8J8B6Y3_9RHOB|nr:tetratricopeptide repeat protein [Thetidibacter halocola]MBS0123124.1 tetratricopeptide repeat protein [Thetidibacter halocola]
MADLQESTLVLRMFGTMSAGLGDGRALRLPGSRQLALIALVATGPDMRRSRMWLIDKLWSSSDASRGRASLRQLLHDMRQRLGPLFDEVFDVTADSVALRPARVVLEGSPEDGEFLEGLDLPQEGFEDWLRDQRLGDPVRIRTAPASISYLPRIAVLPFAEIGDAQAAGIGDCLAHEITSVFARSRLADAISHFSARAIGVAARSPGQVAEQLRPDYLLQGFCRVSDGRITLDASLLDVASDTVILSDRHQFDLRAFLAGDDPATATLAGQVLRLVMSRSIAMTAHRPVSELAAHELMMSGVGLMHAFEQRHFDRARAQLLTVIERCSSHSEPQAWLAQWHLLRIFQKWSDDVSADHAAARDTIAAALDRNPSCPLALAIDANILTVLDRDFDLAEKRFAAAQAINPSSAMISYLASVLATFRGDGARAVELADRGYALSPRDPREPFFQTLSAGSYVAGGRYDRAVEMAEASIRHNPNHLSAHRCRVIGLQLAGRGNEARVAAKELMRLDPDMCVSGYLRQHPAGHTEAGRLWADALAEAGVPAA